MTEHWGKHWGLLAAVVLFGGWVAWGAWRLWHQPAAPSVTLTNPTAQQADAQAGRAAALAEQAARIERELAALQQTRAAIDNQLAAAARRTAQATQAYDQIRQTPLPALLPAERDAAIRRTCAKLAALGIQCEPAFTGVSFN